jgi:hypothetical protein
MDGKNLLGRPLRVRFSEERVNYSEASEVVVDLHRYNSKDDSEPASSTKITTNEESEQSLDKKMDALKHRIQQMQEQEQEQTKRKPTRS